jgi:hypothetical protein
MEVGMRNLGWACAQRLHLSDTRWHARVLPRVYKTNIFNSVIIVNQC